MNFQSANPLRTSSDVFQRAFFRLFWCIIGVVLTSIIGIVFRVGQVLGIWLMVIFLLAIAVTIVGLGVLVDCWRLKK